MQTSNKILLAVIIIIFSIPILLAFSLKRKEKNGEFTVVNNTNINSTLNVRSGSVSAFKVIKVVASEPRLLTCHLKEAETMGFKYYKRDSDDSIAVFTGNDTLYVSYVERKDRSHDDQMEIHLNVRAFNNLVIDGAKVVIDSIGASPGNITITLQNNGEIKDGSEKKLPPEASIQKENTMEDAAVTIPMEQPKIASIGSAGFELFNVVVKDLLIFHFL